MRPENNLEDLRYIRHTLENIGEILKHDITDPIDNIAVQDILEDIDNGLDTLMSIVKNYVEDDETEEFIEELTDYQKNHPRVPFA